MQCFMHVCNIFVEVCPGLIAKLYDVADAMLMQLRDHHRLWRVLSVQQYWYTGSAYYEQVGIDGVQLE